SGKEKKASRAVEELMIAAAVMGGRVKKYCRRGQRQLQTSRANRGQRPRLQLCVNADQWAMRRGGRAEIADETIFRANLDVAGAAARSVNQHRTDRRGKRVAHR